MANQTGTFVLTVTGTAPTGVDNLRPSINANGNTAGEVNEFYIDDVVVVQSSGLPPNDGVNDYFDGDSAGYAWSGTAGASTSTGQTQPTLLAIESQVPAWVQYTYTTVDGGDYATLAASHASYTLMEAAHSTYADIPSNPAA